ncbi:hypothetical protein I4U23_022694 [Adineta vaga]|nr:hypothetical protein I4U23_022694 [Adineta vaga]
METDNKKRQILDIAPRKQWENGHGYCGETSIQSIGLYYGCWISQQLVRSINQGEYLITDDGNDEATLTRLHFDFERWPFEHKDKPQYKNHCLWLKNHLIEGHPCIITVFLDYDEKDDDYDHIMPAIGIEYNPSHQSYDPNDILLFYNLFDLKLIERKLSIDDMIKTRNTCKCKTSGGGCIPRDINYGYAILGIKDEQHVTLPVQLKVNLSDEPNLSTGAPPVLMQGTLIVSNLEPNREYALLRYASHRLVPKSGDIQAFLHSKYHSRHDFCASHSTYTYIDPEKIPSNGSTYYRCVPVKGIDSQKTNEHNEL